MPQILIIGAGRIGQTIAHFLVQSGDYRVHLTDLELSCLDPALTEHPRLTTANLDASDATALERALGKAEAVIHAGPFFLTPIIAEAACRANVHYIDLTEDVRSSRDVQALAETAGSVFAPQCGLAPGFISIVAADLAKRFDTVDQVQMRVGALPKYPTNALKYNLTWSTDGLINEYCQPCEAIIDGKLTQVRPLEGLEEFALDGVRYEAFNTSGGLGTLAESWQGRVREMTYRSVRYPGHHDIMQLLLKDLGLSARRDLLREILEAALPTTEQDVVLIFVSVTGTRQGRLVQESYANKIYNGWVFNRPFGAIQITTASAACAVLDLIMDGRFGEKGFVRQEDIPLDAFLTNRFGRQFAPAGESLASARRSA